MAVRSLLMTCMAHPLLLSTLSIDNGRASSSAVTTHKGSDTLISHHGGMDDIHRSMPHSISEEILSGKICRQSETIASLSSNNMRVGY